MQTVRSPCFLYLRKHLPDLLQQFRLGDPLFLPHGCDQRQGVQMSGQVPVGKTDAEHAGHIFLILNNGVERMAVMRSRLDQVANPFVIGEEGYVRFTGLYRQLAEDNIAAGCIDYTKG